MSEVWGTIIALALITACIRASGPVLLGGRDLPGPVRGVIALVAPALLAALVMVETFGADAGGAFEFDARIGGVLAAAGALVVGLSTLPVVALAAIVTAVIRALG